MDILLAILKILGSLGVFLYGMKVMSEGIQRCAGDGLRKIMATMTHNRVAGVTTGLVTTGLLQSSSATTVMVVSFVNAGLLTLVESIGMIMGANLGTTLTAWIIAFVGKFSIAKIALPIIGVGLPLFFVGKNRWKSFGEALIGFGLLFFGLGLLKESVPDVKGMLADSDPAVRAQAESVLNFVKGLSGHWYSIGIFLFIGVVLTLIVQSSSAAMAITVTLAINGWIGFYDSAAIVLGENIGTTVTAWLASLGANVNARRAARAHLLFNVIGTLWMLAVFYWFANGVQWLADMLPESMRTAKHDSDIGFDLAIFHSSFNLINIFVLIWFVGPIASIVTRWVKEPPPAGGRRRLKFISQSRLDVGELNMPEAEEATRELSALTAEMLDGYMKVFDNPDKDLSAEVAHLKTLEDDADVLTHDITEYLVLCSGAEISSDNAHVVASTLRIVSELEEISDALYRLIRLTDRKYSKNKEFADEATKGVRELTTALKEMVDLYHQWLFQPVDRSHVKKITQLEKQTDKLRNRFNKAAMDRIQSGGDVQTEMLTIDMNNHLESIANSARNVVEIAYYGQHPEDMPEIFDTEPTG